MNNFVFCATHWWAWWPSFFVRGRLWKFMKIAPCESSLSWWDRDFMREGYKVCCQHHSHPYQSWLDTGEDYCSWIHFDGFLCIDESLFLYWIWSQGKYTKQQERDGQSLVDNGTLLRLCKSEIFEISVKAPPSSAFSVQEKEWLGQERASLDKWERYFMFKHFPCSLTQSSLW